MSDAQPIESDVLSSTPVPECFALGAVLLAPAPRRNLFQPSRGVATVLDDLEIGAAAGGLLSEKHGAKPRGAPLVAHTKSAIAIVNSRVLTEDRPENRGFFSESVEVVVEVMVNRQGQINHFDDLGDDLRASSEPCEKVTNVAVVLFDRDGQVFACEELLLRDEAMIAVPIIGDERFAFEADFVEELLACGVITATKNPGDGSPSNRVIGSPNPQFCSLFFT